MTPEILIRPAEAGDLLALGQLGAAMVRTHHEFDAQRFIAATSDLAAGYARFLGMQLGAADSVLLVAVRGDEVLGYVYASLEPASWTQLRGPAGFIHDILVETQVRGQGIATRLLAAASAWLAGRGAPRVVLWTAEKNVGARRLFETLGFRATMVEMTRELAEEPAS